MTEEVSLAVYKHSVDIQVRFGDFDLQGHVSNTMYQTYYDCGRQDYLSLVIGDIHWDVEALVAASIKIDYLKPIWMKTSITVKTRVTHVGNKSITFEHCIVNRDNGEPMSTCMAVLVCYDPVLKQSVPVADQWRKNIMVHEGMI